MNDRIMLKSGSTLELNIAPYSMGWKLTQVFANELKSVGIDLSSIANGDGVDANEAFGMLKDLFLQMLGSPALEQSIFECMGRCLYNGEKITRSTFEDVSARRDFIPCAVEVAKFNLAPFMQDLDLNFLTSLLPKASGQKSE